MFSLMEVEGVTHAEVESLEMLIPILRAARCRSTHHFFAIDALERIGDPLSLGRAGRLRDLLLKHHGSYLRGAKDPDDEFKDFQNHVLHVSDSGWGGAIKACEQWFHEALIRLEARQWPEAAYACGVLSHYFTDPIMPLHTGQSDRESVVHRPMEWSICKSYDEIYSLCKFSQAETQITLTQTDDWIGQAVIDAATIAHRHYDRLIEIFNLQRSTVDPRQGLGKEARQILSELFDLALSGWAAVLTRLATRVDIELPDSSLTMATLLAGLDVPRAWVVRKFADAGQRAAVQRIFDEFTSTGKLRDNLPEEIKVVRRELTKSRTPQPASNKPPETFLQSHSELSLPPTKSELPEPHWVRPQNHGQQSPPRPVILLSKKTVNFKQHGRKIPQSLEPMPAASRQPVTANPNPSVVPVSQGEHAEMNLGDSMGLNEDSPFVDAPSIGPKTARRFAEIGILTVGQFLEGDPAKMAADLNTVWINPELLAEWQSQAELVCDVPALCGYQAQLLVAVGCNSVDELANAGAATLHTAIVQYCATREAQRILRSSAVPTAQQVQEWIDSAVE